MDARRTTILRFLSEPAHVNFGGKVHGGIVMKWIDQAGYACAAAWSGKYCVTVFVGGIHFIKPITVGSVVEMVAQVIHTGRTSLHIAIDIYAGDPRQAETPRCAHCVIVFVALDEHGKPSPVPVWTPVTERDRQLEGYALRLVDLRKGMEAEMAATLKLGPDPVAMTGPGPHRG